MLGEENNSNFTYIMKDSVLVAITQEVCLGLCAGFAWARVNFLRNSQYEAMICAGNRVDNSGRF